MPIYKLLVWDTLKAGWDKTYGVKGTFWVALIILFVISLTFALGQAVIKESAPTMVAVAGLICQVITFLLQMGIVMMGIWRAFNMPISYKLMFKTFEWDYFIRIIGLYFLFVLIFAAIGIILIVPMVFIMHTGIYVILTIILAIILMIYLSVRFSLAVPFVLEQKAGPIVAIKLSWEASRGNFWSILGLILMQILILIVSAIPLGIGLIWTMPFMYVTYGEMYKNLLNNVGEKK